MQISTKFSFKKYKIIRILIKAIIVIGFCIAMFQYFYVAFQTVVNEERERASRVANSINLHLQGRLMALNLLSNAPAVRNLDAQGAQTPLDHTVKLLGITNAVILDPLGHVISSSQPIDFTPQYNQQESFQTSLRGFSTISDRIILQDGQNDSVNLNVPIFNHTRVVGVLTAGVSLNEIGYLVRRETVSNERYVYVIDGQRQFVYHPGLDRNYPESARLLKSHAADFFNSSSGTLIARSFLDGIDKLFVFESVQDTNWRVISVMPMNLVYRTIWEKSRTEILLLLLLLVSVALLYHLLCQAKEYQQRMEAMRVERLKTVNQMAAGMAHEIRNPLTSIKGFIQLIQRKAEPSTQGYLEVVFTELERIERLTNEFQMLAKPLNPHAMQKVDLVKNIKEVILLTQGQAENQKINVVLKKASNMDTTTDYGVAGNESQLKQVWLNLLRNAMEAIGQKGTIEVEVLIVSGQAVVKIKDDGMGIHATALAKLGTPFFTTKETGTGLGLSVCYNIIEQHKGKIQVDSQLGKGTLFTVFLPLARV